MKKLLITIFAVILITNIMYADIKEGKYSVKEDKYSFWGWKGYLNIEIKNGKIVNVEFDYENKDGKKQSEDENYNKNMYKSKNINPKIFTEKLEKEILLKQSFEKIDSIAGATQSRDKFIEMGKLLMEKSEKGGTGDYILKNKKLENK